MKKFNKDCIGQEILVGDYVHHYNNVYLVQSFVKNMVRILLVNPSKTTRPKNVHGWECAVLDRFAAFVYYDSI